MPALRLIPELRGPAQVLRYGGGHAADDLSDNLESRKVTDRQRRWVIARGGALGGDSQGNGRHVQPPLKVTEQFGVEKWLYVTFLVTMLPSSSIKCSSVIDSTGTFLACSPWKRTLLKRGTHQYIYWDIKKTCKPQPITTTHH